MTRLNLSALLLGATALSLPLAATPAAAQQQQGQQAQGEQPQGQRAQGQQQEGQQAQGQQTQGQQAKDQQAQGQQAQQEQGQQQQTQQAAAGEQGKLGACERLSRLIEEAADEDILEEFRDASQVAERKDAEECTVYISRIEKAGGISAQAKEEGRGITVITDAESFARSEPVTETVKIQREALVTGDVFVRQPVPQVSVQQGEATVEVAERPVQVEVNQKPARIEVQQQPSNVHVDMPAPTISIEQPAPTIVITMPPPGVNVSQSEPQVQVVMADPVVEVTQPEPKVEVNVNAEIMAPNELAQLRSQGKLPEVSTEVERIDQAGQMTSDQAAVEVAKAEPIVRFVPSQEEGQFSFNQANPQVVYVPAEPNIDVSFADEPKVEVRQVGEPQVRIVSAEQQDQQQQASAQGQGAQQQQANAQQQQGQATQQQQQANAQQDQQNLAAQQQGQQQQQARQQANAQGAQGESASSEDVRAAGRGDEQQRLSVDETNRLLSEGFEPGAEPRFVTATVADLQNRDVLTVQGEKVGEIAGVVSNGGQNYVVIEHGGFLGIGDDKVAIPAGRVALRGQDALLLGLSENQLEALPKYDSEGASDLARNQSLQIGAVQ